MLGLEERLLSSIVEKSFAMVASAVRLFAFNGCSTPIRFLPPRCVKNMTSAWQADY
jgi:hypothetical protein